MGEGRGGRRGAHVEGTPRRKEMRPAVAQLTLSVRELAGGLRENSLPNQRPVSAKRTKPQSNPSQEETLG